MVLSIVKIGKDECELISEFSRNFSATVSAILFLRSGELLVAATWEGVIIYFDVESGLEDSTYVDYSRDFDAVTSLCTAKRIGKIW